MIFDYRSYKKLFNYLCDLRGRGTTTELAEYLGCRPGFVSQVLKGDTHFSLEHLLKTCQFFKLSEVETHYTLLLGQYEKAGSHELQKFFRTQIDDIQETQKRINSKIAASGPAISEADMGVYYSHWGYMAAHMLVSLKNIKTATHIADRLGLPLGTIEEVCQFLLSRGMIEEKGSGYVIGKTRLHLPASSPLVRSLHQNLRMKAIENLSLKSAENLHYSSVLTLSQKDAQEIRALILELIKAKEKILKDSPDETAVVLNLDYFYL